MAGFLAVTLLAAVGVQAVPSLSSRADSLAGLSLSQQCQNTLSGLMNSPAATCLNLPGTVAVISTVANSSYIPPLNTWLSNFCAADPCTADQLSSTIGSVADGCPTELSFSGLTKDAIVQNAVQYFDDTKEALCLRDKGHGNELCAITTLTNLQTILGGPLTPALLAQKYYLLIANNYALAKQLACTPCASAAFAIVRPALPQEFLSMIDSFVGDQCGVDFTSTPTGSIAVVTGVNALAAAQATATRSAAGHIAAQGAVVGGAVGVLSALLSLF